MHCLSAFHDTRTAVGQGTAAKTGMTQGLEVTDDVFESAANIDFDQAEPPADHQGVDGRDHR
jgi:ornithine carbamoyltransferase